MGGHSLLDRLAGDQLPGVCLLDAPFDFGQEEQPLRGVLDRGVIGQSLHGLKHFFFRRYGLSMPG
jgi:hypothetical protein